jgi:hypothetical protein
MSGGRKAGTAGAIPARSSLGGDLEGLVRLLLVQPSGLRRPHDGGKPAGSGQKLLGSVCHLRLLQTCDPLCCLNADGFPHGGKDMRLGNATQIGPHRRRPVRRHVERDRRRQSVGCRMGVGLALPRLLHRINGEQGAMGEQRHDAGMVQTGNEAPQVGHIARYVRRPSGMTIRQRLARRRVLDPVRVRSDASLCGVLRALFGCFLSLLSGMNTSVSVTVAGVAVVSMAMVVMILLLMGLGFAQRSAALKPFPLNHKD